MKVLIFIFMFICSINAQWMQTSLVDNIIVYAYATNGNNIFAGTDLNGVFLSADNGTSWNSISNGLPSLTTVYALGFSSNGTLIAGTKNSGIFLYNGSSWSTSNSGLSNSNGGYDVTSIVVNGNDIFIGTFGNGVFHSTNNGASWSAVNNGLANGYIRSLTMNGSSIFVGIGYPVGYSSINPPIPAHTMYNGGVFRSTNNGANWSAVNNGVLNMNVETIAANGSSIFVGTGLPDSLDASRGGKPGDIFLSTNNGSNWTLVNPGFANIRYCLSLAISNNNIFVGTNDGIFLSTNDGSNWTTFGLANMNVWSVAIINSFVFASSSENLWNMSVSAMGTIKKETTQIRRIAATTAIKHINNTSFYDILGRKTIKRNMIMTFKK